MHYLYRYVCILNVFFYMCIWTIVCNKEFIIIIVARMDEWDKECIISKMFRLKDFGTNGPGLPVLMSQSREVSRS